MGGRGASSGIGGGGGKPNAEFKEIYSKYGATSELRKDFTLKQAYQMARQNVVSRYGESNVKDRYINNALENIGRKYREDKQRAEHNALRNEYLSLIKGQKGASYERQQINLMPTSTETLKRKIAEIKKKR